MNDDNSILISKAEFGKVGGWLNKRLTLFWKFYELSDTIPQQALAYDWSQFENFIKNR